VDTVLDTLLNTLDNPHLALLQWEEVFSVVQVLPPPPCEQTFVLVLIRASLWATFMPCKCSSIWSLQDRLGVPL